MKFILRVVDKINQGDIKLCVSCLKAGDMVVAVPDEHPWGTSDLNNPYWRIIDAPNLTESAAKTFLVGEIEDVPQRPNPLLQAREFMFDLNHPSIDGEFRAYLEDSDRVIPQYKLDWPLDKIMALKVKRPSRRNEAEL